MCLKKVIFLVDMNAFFISCEMARNPDLQNKAAAVAGDPQRRKGIILAANYKARSFGVKTTMTLNQAYKLCPELVVVPPDHSFYEQKSREVMNILSRYSPVVEQNSIDEAWLDMTGTEKLFGSPYKAAESIMSRIMDELGLMCSIGISENKFLSKMASEMKKPMGITELWQEDISTRLWPLPVESMYGIGKQTARRLNSLGILTIGDLANTNPRLLAKYLGKTAIELHQHANGIDLSPVAARKDDEIKSISRSMTLSKDITDISEAEVIIMEMAEEIGASARMHNKKGRKVSITIKYSDFSVITRQTTIPPTYLTKDIIAAGTKLLKENWNPDKPVRLLGLGLGGFGDKCETGQEQVSIFDLIMDTEKTEITGAKDKSEKEEKLEKAIDVIRSRYGSDKINRAIFLKKDNTET